MKLRLLCSAAVAACAISFSGTAAAQSQLVGDTYFISYDIDTFSYGRFGYADVGQASFFIEFYRGFVQFNLIGQAAAEHATLSFDYLGFIGPGLHPSESVVIDRYRVGRDETLNGPSRQRDPYPYYSPSVATVGTLSSLTALPGRLTFDVTESFNSAVADADGYLRLRLIASAGPEQVPRVANNLLRFTNFAIAVTPVPEPETYALMLAGLAAAGLVRLRKNG
jgi:hypothetical protein